MADYLEETFVSWSLADVQSAVIEMRLDEYAYDQQFLRDVGDLCAKRFDANIGMNWDIIATAIDEMVTFYKENRNG